LNIWIAPRGTGGLFCFNTVKYLPFGSCRNSPDLPTDKLFTGQRFDSTGLYFYNARYYDPTIGRFISPDTIIQNPSHPQDFNRYTYCSNNPLKYIDPSGHDTSDMMFLSMMAASGCDPSDVLTEAERMDKKQINHYVIEQLPLSDIIPAGYTIYIDWHSLTLEYNDKNYTIERDTTYGDDKYPSAYRYTFLNTPDITIRTNINNQIPMSDIITINGTLEAFKWTGDYYIRDRPFYNVNDELFTITPEFYTTYAPFCATNNGVIYSYFLIVSMQSGNTYQFYQEILFGSLTRDEARDVPNSKVK
jgi:RHS repeat-associated protein